MEQTSYRLVTEKYDQQQPGLPIVTLWDNVQQGVGLCYFSQTIWLITCDSCPAVALTATKTGQTPSWRLPERCWRLECEWEQRESLRMSAICRPPAVGSPLYSPDTWHTQLLSFIEWQTGAAVFTCVVRPVQRCLERSRGSSCADLMFTLKGCSMKIIELVSSNAVLLLCSLSGVFILGRWTDI